jgi:Phosphatidylinositol N-acetylglucosaminyltransferase
MMGNHEEDIFFKILIGCMVAFFAFLFIHWKNYTWKCLENDLKTAAFLTSALLFLTPVLKSLTVSYSEDTIILLVVSKLQIVTSSNNVVFIALHLLMYDFGRVNRPVVFDNITQNIIGSPVSLNAIFFATILLSSRLEKVRQVYLLLLLSMT